ncbi:MopE-related protein, partial [Neolewinella lacunae]
MRKFYFALLLATLVSHLPAQDFTLIADINQGTGNSATFKDNVSIYFQDKLFFSANDGINGDELWVYENSELRLVRDINAGSGGSEIQHMHIVNGRLVFVARTASHGREWWTTDGTSEGTTLLKDINPGSSHGVWVDHGYTAEGFIVFNNTLYFTGISGDDYELWKTDGTPNGTVLVRNISLNGSSLPNSYTVFNNQVYFSCREGLWRTNGTTAGTVLVRNDDPEDFFGFEPSQLFSTENFMLMIQNQDLWVSNGTRAGTFKIRDFQSISFNWIGPRFERVNGTILFAANDGVSGDELWRTDGTAQGTTLVKDVWPGANGYAPQNAVVFKDKLYYKGNNGSSDIELFVSDGTEAGTLLFRDFNSNGSGFALPSEIVADTNFIYLNAGRSFAQEIWVSDGTAANTFEININPEGQSRPTSLYLFDGKLFCFAQTDATGYEPYIIDLISQPIDEDNDGFTADVDCDDLNPAINPGQMEIPYNGLDDDCDPMTLDDDLDQDGFVLAEDCDDINPAVNPGQME